MKKKLLVILFCLSIAEMVLAGVYPTDFSGATRSRQARPTINIDLNVEGDANAYMGKAAYDTNNALYDDGLNTWKVFYPNIVVARSTIPGWGFPMGSPRSSHLGDSNDPNNPAVYARQVWIGSRNTQRVSYRDLNDANYSAYPGLMNDGFLRTAGEPNIFLWGQDAYAGGNYDIYVYGARPGTFKRVRYNAQTAEWDPCAKTIDGIVPAGKDFNEGNNYVVFPNVTIEDATCILKTLYVDGVRIGAGGNAAVLRYADEGGDAGTSRSVGIGGDANADPRTTDLLNHPPNFHPALSGLVGQIDEFAIYNRILDDVNIVVHYEAGIGLDANYSVGDGNDVNRAYFADVNRTRPVVWLRFEDASSAFGAAARNSGSFGTSYNGKYLYDPLYGGQTNLVAGIVGKAVDFVQGTDVNAAYVNIKETNRNLELANLTVECWVKTTQATGFPHVYNRNVTNGDSGAYGLTLFTRDSEGTVTDVCAVGMIGGNNISYVDVNNPPINNGNWHHVVATYKRVPGGMFISYSNVINGLQLVSTRRPLNLLAYDGNAVSTIRTKIPAGRYDVAGERSGRAMLGTTVAFGPAVMSVADPNWARPNLGGIERHEFMEYDFDVEEANAGKYSITLDVAPSTDGRVIANLRLDDVNIGSVTRPQSAPPGPTNPIEVNITPGSHTFMWWHNGYDSSSTDYDILDINFVRISTSTEPNYVNGVASDCNGVKRYELLYAGDLNQDCNVNRADLYIFTNSWLECDDPNWRNCK